MSDASPTVAAPPERAPSRHHNGRMADMDGLRAIAITLVLLDHFVSACFPVKIVRDITQFGWVGVDLFFVLSGFLIGGILLDHRTTTNYFRVFYLRRFLRIIPLYFLLLLPMVVVVLFGLQQRLPGHHLQELNWGIIALFLCLQQNLGGGFVFNTPGYMAPAWSLAIEEQFYLLMPPLVRRLSSRGLLILIFAGIATAPLFRAGEYLWFSDPGKAGAAAGALLPCRWDSLLSGVLIAYALRRQGFREWTAKRSGLLRAACFFLGAGVIAAAIFDPFLESRFGRIAGFSWLAAFFACVLLLARANENGALHRWLSRPILKPLATISYGLYLFQGPTMAVRESVLQRLGVAKFSWPAFGINLATLAVTLLLALLSWQFFESRLIKLGHKHQYEEA